MTLWADNHAQSSESRQERREEEEAPLGSTRKKKPEKEITRLDLFASGNSLRFLMQFNGGYERSEEKVSGFLGGLACFLMSY